MTFVKAKNPKQVRRAAKLWSLEPGDPRYVNLDDIRGYNLRAELEKELYIDPDDPHQFARIVYSGHRGNGKTTELKKLMERLKDQGYVFVFRDAHGDLGSGLEDYTDLMLYLAQMALEHVAQVAPVSDDLLRPVLDWFTTKTKITKDEYESKMTLESKGEVKFQIPGLLKLLSSLTARITGGHKATEETRLVLKNQGGEFLARLNELFGKLREALRDAGQPAHLVIVADSLDRYHPEVMDKVFGKAVGFFEMLEVHMILTLPLALIYTPRQERVSDWGFTSYILPMPKIRQRTQPWDAHWEEGVNRLTEAIRRRVDVDLVFGPDDEKREACLRDLVLASGGSLREMMHLLVEAAKVAWDEPINQDHVAKAVINVRRDFLNVLEPHEDIPVLLEIHEHKHAPQREKAAPLFFYRLALEYNGEQWADVHPLVYGSEVFQTALHAEEAPQ